MKNLLGRFAAVSVGAVLLSAAMLPFWASAKKSTLSSNLTTASGVGVAISGTGIVNPGKIISGGVGTVYPFPPNAQDEIVQFYNLRIQDISGNTVTAQSDWINPCIMMGTKAGASAVKNSDIAPTYPYPCPLPPVQILKIQVNSSTILLLRNRTHATLTDFAVGDHINVYGFQNSDNSVDALIVRDLDKPVIIQPVELNNMEITAINGSTLTVQFHINCKGEICPMMGVPASAGANFRAKTTMPSMPMLYPMPRTVITNSDTKFTDRNGSAINLGDLKVGDQVNISGTIKSNWDPNAEITAKKIQNLSIPQKSSTLSIQSLNGPGKIQAGESGEWRIVVNGGNQSNLNYQITWGDEMGGGMGTAAPTRALEDNSVGTFTHAYQTSGTYTVQVVVTDANGASARASATVFVF